MSEHTINSISEFVGIITGLNRKLVHNGVNAHEVLLFRGMNDTSHVLLPYLIREVRDSESISVFSQERNLIESAKNRLPDIFGDELSPIELLAMLQHYGIPTRMLDITENALVALYFACGTTRETADGADGEVIVFKADDMYMPSIAFINAIADSYRIIRGGGGNSGCSLEDFYMSAMHFPYFAEYRHLCGTFAKRGKSGRRGGQEQGTDGSQSGEDWVYENCRQPVFIRAPIRSHRQQAQQGRYILFPNKIETRASGRRFFTPEIEPIDINSDIVAGRIIIPHDVKKKLLNELELFGISASSLFCDNVDIICEDIKRRFEYLITGDGES